MQPCRYPSRTISVESCSPDLLWLINRISSNQSIDKGGAPAARLPWPLIGKRFAREHERLERCFGNWLTNFLGWFSAGECDVGGHCRARGARASFVTQTLPADEASLSCAPPSAPLALATPSPLLFSFQGGSGPVAGRHVIEREHLRLAVASHRACPTSSPRADRRPGLPGPRRATGP